MFFNLPMADSFTTPRSLHCAQQDSTNHPASKDNVLAGHWHYSPATRCISDLLLGGKIQQESLIFLSCASRKMDFSKVTIVVAFFCNPQEDGSSNLYFITIGNCHNPV